MSLNRKKELLIQTDTKTVCGIELTYRLIAVQKAKGARFLIVVNSREEQAGAEIGHELFRAMELYRIIVDGSVTPCTLSDILEDFAYETHLV